mgnify:CR=1 FL=1
MIEVGKGKLLHFLKLRFPDTRAPAERGAGGVARIEQSRDQREQRAERHQGALPPDGGDVPVCDADVDDVRHQHRNHKLKGALHEHHQAPYPKIPPVWAKVCQQALQILRGRFPLFCLCKTFFYLLYYKSGFSISTGATLYFHDFHELHLDFCKE